ncbi:MAG: tetraacyldisaccharide 4'-kinase [Alphaproteobacteria bacterium]
MASVRAPEFWSRPGVLPALLAPAAAIWGFGAKLRQSGAKPVHVGIPVICVGNLVAGGAGKTPTALALGALLKAQGGTPHFLTRGYGGELKGPAQVDPSQHASTDVGDEALLLAAQGPTWVSHDRVAGARAAEAAGATVIVMDDGFQNPNLAKDLSVIVIDGGYGFGNGRLMPAGPLREQPSDGLARAQAAILIGEDRHGVVVALEGKLPVLRARLEPDENARRLAGRTVLAFAGIARPAKFYDTLRHLGCNIALSQDFPDHHPYTPDEIMALCESASAFGALPVTTEKDLVRFPAEARGMVETVRVRLVWDDPAAIAAILDRLRG